ncbi:2-amino-4-hydroxy-6-hydroxymethyldihydropteridine diphosphokinase [Adlercreutzia sp. ZJ138]|uniref:2-amino-4-hydroxy-6- hydroxymethyldihydropteridine diphosphokinase n=1 Tax=Adlercreutzia sp. ZJ138 TaxID=2709405 RepID=UPI0013E9E88F|nr:2-amino-4-hydroxy-6-hydroxymethyldihydropteridine diphosphokinase [Adlercreutzia sp. ZJ138]
MAFILDGAQVAAAIDQETENRVALLTQKSVIPTLAIIRADGEEDANAYSRGTQKCCKRLGIQTIERVLSGNSSEKELMLAISDFANDNNIHGIVVCKPFTGVANWTDVSRSIPVVKDVDGMSPESILFVCGGAVQGFVPCVVEATLAVLEHYDIQVDMRNVTVVGDGLSVGRPLWLTLCNAGATVTICNDRTADIARIIKSSDVVLFATGCTEHFGKECFKPGQTVIDVGIGCSKESNSIAGDVRFDEAEPIVDAITPVPGGVGVVSSSILALHVVRAAERAQDVSLVVKDTQNDRGAVIRSPKTALVSLGSNVGDRRKQMDAAVDALRKIAGVRVCSVSDYVESEPAYKEDQAVFANAVAVIETSLEPMELLDVLHDIENDLGRVRHEANGPRTIDLDILDYEGVVSSDPVLTLPHPRILERDFVVTPLEQVRPQHVFANGTKLARGHVSLGKVIGLL